jgi:hypothetical protein
MGEGEKHILDLRSRPEFGPEQGEIAQKPSATAEAQFNKEHKSATRLESRELSANENRQKGMNAITEVVSRNKEAFRIE